MPEEAVLDAPEIDLAPETVDSPEPESSEPETPETPSNEPEVSRETEGVTTPAISGGKLSEAAKATLAEIKAKDPVLARELHHALYQNDKMRQVFPGGLKEAQQIRQTIDQIGGIDGLREKTGELEHFHGLDAAFTSADPKFIGAMTETPEGQAAFVRLAPQMIAKFAELNRDGYGAFIAQSFKADMDQEGIPLALERLQDLLVDNNLAENPRAIQIWNKLSGYLGRVTDHAKKPVVVDKPQAAGGDDRSKQLDEREQNLVKTEWRGAADSERMKIFGTEFARLAEGRKLTDVQTAAIKELYASRLQGALGKLPNFNQNAQRFFSAKDKDGFLRHTTAAYKSEIPKALKAAFDAIVPARPGPKPAAANGTKPAVNGTPAVANGFAFVATRPGPGTVDFGRTNADMIRMGKAILTTGKKVQWKTS